MVKIINRSAFLLAVRRNDEMNELRRQVASFILFIFPVSKGIKFTVAVGRGSDLRRTSTYKG
jgi:hypothetical protein